MMKPLFATLLAVLLLPAIVAAATMPPLPKGYSGWKKSERKLVTDKNSLFYGIHYIYADKKALKGYKAGNKFPEGSTLVVDYFNIKEGSAADGPKNMVVMMRKDKRNKDTGGWQFAGYGADGKPSSLDPVGTCFGCHQKDAAKQDFVISTVKDFKL
jgi:hypothetical protein